MSRNVLPLSVTSSDLALMMLPLVVESLFQYSAVGFGVLHQPLSTAVEPTVFGLKKNISCRGLRAA